MKEYSLTEGKIGPALIRFAVPFLLANLLQSLYGAADMFVVGQFSGSAAVSAVSTGSQILNTITHSVLGLCTGGTVLLAQQIGRKNDDGSAKAVGTMAVAFAVIGVILTPLMLIFTRQMAELMQTPREAFEQTMDYVRICACGVPFILGYNVTAGIFRGIGDSKTPVRFIFIACVLNIIADYVFVGVLGMEAAGAALATVVAQGVSFLLSLLHMKKEGFEFDFGRRHLRIDGYSLRWIFKVGTPLALQSAFISVSFLIITAIINGMGLVASAAVGVTEKLISFFMLPPGAFSAATATMVGQNIGARKPERAMKTMTTSIIYSLIVSGVLFVIAQVIPELCASVFTKDPEVIEAAAQYLLTYSWDCILVCFVFNLNSYFSGCGKSLVTAAHNIVATFMVRVPVSYFASKTAGVTLWHMGLAAPAASLLSVIICVVYFWYLKKKDRLYS